MVWGSSQGFCRVFLLQSTYLGNAKFSSCTWTKIPQTIDECRNKDEQACFSNLNQILKRCVKIIKQCYSSH